MHKVYNVTVPETFFEVYQKISHPHPTGFSKLCYKISKLNLTKCKYRTLSRGQSQEKGKSTICITSIFYVQETL